MASAALTAWVVVTWRTPLRRCRRCLLVHPRASRGPTIRNDVAGATSRYFEEDHADRTVRLSRIRRPSAKCRTMLLTTFSAFDQQRRVVLGDQMIIAIR